MTLSGGVDSSSLGALAARSDDLPVSTLSFVPPLDDPTRATQLRYVDSLLAECKFEPSWKRALDVEAWVAVLKEAPRVAFPIQHPALCALPGLQREADIRVQFEGSSLTKSADRSLRCRIGSLTPLPPSFFAAEACHSVARRFVGASTGF